METKEYTVERVEDMRTVKGSPSTLNSWEPLKKSKCMECIASFEESQKKKVIKKKKRPLKAPKAKFKKTKNNISKAKEDEDDDGPKEEEITPVLTTLEPLKILGATDANGETMFLMQWKGSDHADLVAAKVANIQWPQIVIKFYEERLIWHNV